MGAGARVRIGVFRGCSIAHMKRWEERHRGGSAPGRSIRTFHRAFRGCGGTRWERVGGTTYCNGETRNSHRTWHLGARPAVASSRARVVPIDTWSRRAADGVWSTAAISNPEPAADARAAPCDPRAPDPDVLGARRAHQPRPVNDVDVGARAACSKTGRWPRCSAPNGSVSAQQGGHGSRCATACCPTDCRSSSRSYSSTRSRGALRRPCARHAPGRGGLLLQRHPCPCLRERPPRVARSGAGAPCAVWPLRWREPAVTRAPAHASEPCHPAAQTVPEGSGVRARQPSRRPGGAA